MDLNERSPETNCTNEFPISRLNEINSFDDCNIVQLGRNNYQVSFSYSKINEAQ